MFLLSREKVVSAFELGEGAISGPLGSLCPTFLKEDGAGCRFIQAQPFNHYAWVMSFYYYCVFLKTTWKVLGHSLYFQKLNLETAGF